MAPDTLASRRLGGVLASAVTTFDTWQGALTAEPFRANVRAHIAADVAGVVVGGSVGEVVLLTEEERARVAGWAREAVPADRWLIVGTGAESTSLTLQRTQAAGQLGADAVLVLPPSYYGAVMTRAALADHYWRVVDESACGVVLYNAPQRAGFSLGGALVHALAAHEQVLGIVDASGDAAQLGEYLGAQHAHFSVLTGDAGGLADALATGARGAMLDEATFAPDCALAVERALRRGDRAATADAQTTLGALQARIGTLGPAGVKAALDAVGLHGGPVRAPLGALTAEQLADVRACLREAGLLGVRTHAP